MATKLWVDCDAGTDDAQALLMAMADPGVELVGVSCVNGNVDIDKVAVNVAHVFRVCARHGGVAGCPAAVLHANGVDAIAAHRGARKPLVRKPVAAEFWHGVDGLGDVDWSARGEEGDRVELPSTAAGRDDPSRHAALALSAAARAHPRELVVVCIGPLTNIALAARLDPRLPSLVKRVVVMGGAADGFGNATACAEFNFFADPESANIVLTCFPCVELVGWKATFTNGLDLGWTRECWFADGSGASSGATPTGLQAFVAAISKNGVDKQVERGEAQYLIPDPLAMAVALRPGCVATSIQCQARVECAPGALTYGQLVLDQRGLFLGGGVTDIDADEAGVHASIADSAIQRAHTLTVVTALDLRVVKELLLRSVGARP